MPTILSKLFATKLYLPDGKNKGQSNKMSRVTASPTELNKLDGVTATTAELNLTDNMWASVTTTFVDGTNGTGTVQFVFKDAAGTTMATPVAGQFYVSEVATGLTVDALDTGLAVLTNGVLTLVDTGVTKYYNYVTTAAGLLGATITSAADSYWFVFVHPTGKLVISDEMAITGP
jgi:hypothetical protein